LFPNILCGKKLRSDISSLQLIEPNLQIMNAKLKQKGLNFMLPVSLFGNSVGKFAR
jgi:hypothetical protein